MQKILFSLAIAATIQNHAFAWTFEQDKPAGMSTFSQGSVILHDGEAHLISMAIDSGKREWQVTIEEDVFLGAATAPGRVYANVCTGTAMQRNTYGPIQVIAIDTQNESILWRYGLGDAAPWAQAAAGLNVLVHMGPFLTAIDLESGEPLWRYKSRSGPITAIDTAAQRVAVATTDGHFYLLDETSGEERWHTPLTSRTASKPLIDNGHVFAGAMDGTVFCFTLDSAKPLWQKKVTGGLEGSLASDARAIYFGTREGHVYALDKANGNILWDIDRGRRRENASLFGRPILHENRLWISTYKRDIIALSLNDGSEQARLKTQKPLVQFGIGATHIAYKPFGGQTLESVPIPK